MKNTIQDLMNHQFAMLETVTDPNIKGDLLQEELSRAKAVVEIVGVMVGTYRVALDAQKAISERFNRRFCTDKKPDNIKDVKIARGWTREPKGRKRILPQYITVNKEKIRLDVYVYECVHGKLPSGYSVIHLDNDLNNNNINNLRAAPKEIRRLFSGAGYSKMPQVLAPALYAQVMLRHAIKRLSS
ncbi:TPA: HNH endonuclease [Klebsiella pneumoniae]